MSEPERDDAARSTAEILARSADITREFERLMQDSETLLAKLKEKK